jgi:hypothetical protein
MIPLKKPEIQGAKFSKNKTYLSYVTVSEKLKQRSRLGFFSGIIIDFAKPLLDAAQTDEEKQRAIGMAIVMWNVAIKNK